MTWKPSNSRLNPNSLHRSGPRGRYKRGGIGDDMMPLKAVIDQFLQTHRMHSKMDEVDVVLAWKEVFGDVINKKTRHLKLQHDGTLLVSLNSGPLKEEFNHEKDKVVSMLNAYLKKDIVKSVRVR